MRPLPFSAVCLASIVGCAGRGSLLPDYSEMLAAGVEPHAEAAVVEAHLGEAGYVCDERAERETFVALGFVRASDGHRAVRVVTSRGVAFALDSGAMAIGAPPGDVHLDAERSGTDVDGDERPDVVITRSEPDRQCWLVLALTEDGGLDALRVDADGLDADACLEGFTDVDGHGTEEAIVRTRSRRLQRTRVPTADVPLERDEAGIYHRRPPPVAFLAAVRARLTAAITEARVQHAEEELYTLAVETALVSRAAGESLATTLAAFDEVVTTVVWSPALAEAVRSAREHIARDWR